MSRGPEAAFWKKVRRAWSGHSVRVEASDGEVDAGTPDTVLSVGYKGGFVELKVWPDNVSSIQLAWHQDAIERGAYCMVLSELPDGDVWLGNAEDYDALIRACSFSRNAKLIADKTKRGKRSLHDALKVIRCALIG